MRLRKVTAIEEKVLALAVEWAEKREAWSVQCKSIPCGGALTSKAFELSESCEVVRRQLLIESARLLKQRAKGEKK